MRHLNTLSWMALLVAAAGLLIAAGPALAEGELCSFTLTGSVAWVWYPGPYPPPLALLRVEFWVDDEPMSYDIFCEGELALVCVELEPGTPVLVLGEDHGERKIATHVGVWLMPSASSGEGR